MLLSFLNRELETTLFEQDEMIVLLILVWETWKQPSYRSMNSMKASCLMSGQRPYTVYSMRRLLDALEPILIL